MVLNPARQQDSPSDSVLKALGDADAQDILEALCGPKAARELSEECDIPLSTVYRKLALLTEADLVEEETEIRLDGQHTTRYLIGFDSVTISVDADQSLVASLERVKRPTNERLEDSRSKVQEET